LAKSDAREGHPIFTFPSLWDSTQAVEYAVLCGISGKLLESVMIRKQSDSVIKKFFARNKSYANTHSLPPMAYNEKLADRIRKRLADLPRVEEKEMMGGTDFHV